MKRLLLETNSGSKSNYQLFAETIPTKDHTCLRFYSVWTGAKDPEAPQTKTEVFLDKNALLNLKNLLEGVK